MQLVVSGGTLIAVAGASYLKLLWANWGFCWVIMRNHWRFLSRRKRNRRGSKFLYPWSRGKPERREPKGRLTIWWVQAREEIAWDQALRQWALTEGGGFKYMSICRNHRAGCHGVQFGSVVILSVGEQTWVGGAVTGNSWYCQLEIAEFMGASEVFMWPCPAGSWESWLRAQARLEGWEAAMVHVVLVDLMTWFSVLPFYNSGARSWEHSQVSPQLYG